eukprot:122208_1
MFPFQYPIPLAHSVHASSFGFALNSYSVAFLFHSMNTISHYYLPSHLLLLYIILMRIPILEQNYLLAYKAIIPATKGNEIKRRPPIATGIFSASVILSISVAKYSSGS